MSGIGGRRTPSVTGSRQSVYSHTSSAVRTTATGPVSKSNRHNLVPWYKKPILKSAFYTDLQRGAWHIGFYTMFISVWTIFTSGFDIYCLHEAMPGSKHTGYYIISFDFVYVGNAHVRNLLIMSSVLSLLGGVALFVTNVLLLDGLRKEQETAFKGWLWTMGIFAPWKIIAWVFAGIVNDIIFAYNIIMLIAWFFFNILDVCAFLCIYSLYLELNDLTHLQDLARLKMDTMSSMVPSRAASAAYGSRPTSPHIVNPPHGQPQQYHHLPQNPYQHQQQVHQQQHYQHQAPHRNF